MLHFIFHSATHIFPEMSEVFRLRGDALQHPLMDFDSAGKHTLLLLT